MKEFLTPIIQQQRQQRMMKETAGKKLITEYVVDGRRIRVQKDTPKNTEEDVV